MNIHATRNRIQKLLAFHEAEPAIGRLTSKRIHAICDANRDYLKSCDGPRYPTTIRTLTLSVSPDPEAAWVCQHHLREAWRELSYSVKVITAPESGPEAAIYGNRPHRIKVVKGIPEQLRDRLDAAFSRGDLWDPDGAFERRYNSWEEEYLDYLPAATTPAQTMLPKYRAIFLAKLPALEKLLADMLQMFAPQRA